MNQQARADYLLEDPIFFLDEIWEATKRNRVAALGDVEYDMVRTAVDHKLGRKRGILAPRGIGKSHLVPAVCGLWRLMRDENRRVLVISKSEKHAKFVIGLMKDWVHKIEFLQYMEPADKKSVRWAATEFDIVGADENIQPSVRAIGVDGQLEGNRAHSIYPDDIETENNTKTLESREALKERCLEFGRILYPDAGFLAGETEDPVEIVTIGTFHHEESVYTAMHEELGYTFTTYPIASPKRTDKIINLAPLIKDKLDSGEMEYTDEEGHYELHPTVPLRFPASEILDKMGEGRRGFGMQHMLIKDLGNSIKYPLRLSDLIVYPVDVNSAPVEIVWGTKTNDGSTALEDISLVGFAGDRLHAPVWTSKDRAPYQSVRAYIDIAGRGEDQCGVAVAAQLAGYLHIPCVVGLTGGSSPDDLLTIAHILRDNRVQYVSFEANADITGTWQALFESTLQTLFLNPGDDPAFPTGWRCSVEQVHVTVQKEVRIINALEPVTSTHRLVVDPSVVTPVDGEDRDYDFQYQLTRITNQPKSLRHEDKLDALAGVVSLFATSLRSQPSDAQERIRAKAVDDAIENIRSISRVGRKRKSNWARPHW